MKTDEEIDKFYLKYRIIDSIWSGSLPSYLQELQHRVIHTHAELDMDMLVRILSQIRYEAGETLSNEVWIKINPFIQQALDSIPFMAKIAIIKSYGDVSDKLRRALEKANTYRNEFAHPRIGFLQSKYDTDTDKGKTELRNLTRAIERAKNLFMEHTENSRACIYYVQKQREIIEAENKTRAENRK